MPLFIVQGRFTREYLQGGIARPEDRQAAISQLCEQVGGRLINLYFTTGPHDFAIITEMPDAQTASAVMLAVAARGGIEIHRDFAGLHPGGSTGPFSSAPGRLPAPTSRWAADRGASQEPAVPETERPARSENFRSLCAAFNFQRSMPPMQRYLTSR